MAQGDTPITVVGNLVADPELRFTPNGAAVANFSIASTPRQFNRDTNQWEDGEPLFLTCNCWRGMAENAAESLSKGMRVIVTGNLKQRSYQAKDGTDRRVYEIDVQDVGPSLKYAVAQVQRTQRNQQQSQQSQQQPSGWAVQDNQGGFGQTNDTPPWGAA